MAVYPSWKMIYAVGAYDFLTGTAGTTNWTEVTNGLSSSMSDFTDNAVVAYFKNSPNFVIAPVVIERETMIGKPYKPGQDYLAGTKSTGNTVEGDHAIEEAKFYLASLFQKIMTTSVASVESQFITFMPYSTSPEFTQGKGRQIFLYERHGDNATDGSTMHNVVVSSINYSAASNEPLSYSIETIGRTIGTAAADNVTVSDLGGLSGASENPLLWQDATILIGRPAVLDVDDSGWTTPIHTIECSDDQTNASGTSEIEIDQTLWSDATIGVGDWITLNSYVILASDVTAGDTVFAITGPASASVTVPAGTYTEMTLCEELERLFSSHSTAAVRNAKIRFIYDPENDKFSILSNSSSLAVGTVTNTIAAIMGFDTGDTDTANTDYTYEGGQCYAIHATNAARKGGRNGIYKVTAYDETPVSSIVMTVSPAMTEALADISSEVLTKRSISVYTQVKCGSFSLNLSNNATIQFFDEQEISSITLGRFTGEGDFNQLFATRDNWDAVIDVENSVVRPMIVFWGTGAPAGGADNTDDLHIHFTAQMLAREPEGEDVIMDKVSFSLVNETFTESAFSTSMRLMPIYITVDSGSMPWDYNSGIPSDVFFIPSLDQRVSF